MGVLVAALIDAAQMQSDKRNDAQLSSADWTTIANWSVKSLWRKISAVDPDWYFDQQDFALAGGAAGAAFDLSTLTGAGAHSFAALHGLDLNPDTAQRMTVPRLNFLERNRGRFSRWLPTTLVVNRAYDIRGTQLTITPYEAAGGNYRAYYRYMPYAFTGSADANPLDFEIAAYDEYISVRMAERALGLEESDQSPMYNIRQELLKEILAEHSRDDEAASVIADVEGDDSIHGWY